MLWWFKGEIFMWLCVSYLQKWDFYLALCFLFAKVRFLCGFGILINLPNWGFLLRQFKGEIFNVPLCFLLTDVRFLCGFVFLICRGEIFMWLCVSYLQRSDFYVYVFLICKGKIFIRICVSYMQRWNFYVTVFLICKGEIFMWLCVS